MLAEAFVESLTILLPYYPTGALSGSEFRVPDFGFRVSGVGCRVSGLSFAHMLALCGAEC